MSPPDDGIRRLGENLDQILKGLGAPPADVLTRLAREWPERVGPVLAAHSSVVAMEGDRLLVRVDDAAFATSVRFAHGDLRAWLDDVAGPGAIASITVRVQPRQGPDGGPEKPGRTPPEWP